MYTDLLNFLRCPDCREPFRLTAFVQEASGEAGEVSAGLLHCPNRHLFPVVNGIPRMLPDSMPEHWPALRLLMPKTAPEAVLKLAEESMRAGGRPDFDGRTRSNFSEEWGHHDLGGRTWGMELKDRVRWFFQDPVRIPAEGLRGKVMLDAGCGNGSQSVAYTRLGLEVIAVDLSSGLEHGHAFRELCPEADPRRVHFIQADLQRPPLGPESVDIIHSAGVLHHTPDTLKTFKALTPLLKPGGTFYVWLYKYEKYVTPVVNSIRAVTTRVPAPAFARLSRLMALPFIGFCFVVNALGIRKYGSINRREAALALMDIFGAPYAHCHSFEEVSGWFRAEGFQEVWPCNEGRRGFGACGRMASVNAKEFEEPVSALTLSAK